MILKQYAFRLSNVKKDDFIKLVLSVLPLLAVVSFLKWNEVSKDITLEDQSYIMKIMGSDQLDTFRYATYEKEVWLLKLVQEKVLSVAPVNQEIEHYKNREPKDLYLNKYGLCYDRSRTIEKIMINFGFETRHIAIYRGKKKSWLPDYLDTESESHAFSEINTSRGWMFIDSNDYFIGLSHDNSPVSINELHESGFNSISWSDYNNMNYDVIYKTRFTYLYGLYSRHGYFYAPFNFLPDINLSEFSMNIFIAQ